MFDQFRKALYALAIAITVGSALVAGANFVVTYNNSTVTYLGNLVTKDDQIYTMLVDDELVDEHYYFLVFKINGQTDLAYARYQMTDVPFFNVDYGTYSVTVTNSRHDTPWGDHVYYDIVNLKRLNNAAPH